VNEDEDLAVLAQQLERSLSVDTGVLDLVENTIGVSQMIVASAMSSARAYLPRARSYARRVVRARGELVAKARVPSIISSICERDPLRMRDGGEKTRRPAGRRGRSCAE